MSYLSNTRISLELRKAAADAALSYVEAVAHATSLQALITSLQSKGEVASFELIQALDDALDATTDAHILARSLAAELANFPPR